MTDPRGRVEVGKGAIDLGTPHHANRQPFARQGSEREKVVGALDRTQLSEQREVGTEARKSFDEARQPLGRSIENTIVAIGIVETVSKRAVAVSQKPIRRLPCIRTAAKTKYWPNRPTGFECHRSMLRLGMRVRHSGLRAPLRRCRFRAKAATGRGRQAPD